MADPILLVEDDLDLAHALLTALEPMGVPIEHSPSGELAIELVQAKRYALVVAEMAFAFSGGVSGGYVVKALRRVPKERRPAVMMIADGSASLRGVDRSSVAAILFKPLNLDLFADYVAVTYARVAGRSPSVRMRERRRRPRSFCGACNAPIPSWPPDDPESFPAWVEAPCAGCGMPPRLVGGRSEWPFV